MALMRNYRPKKRVFVDEKPVEVDRHISSKDLIVASGHDPSRYSIVSEDDYGGTQLIPATKRIHVKDGQRFETSLNGIGG